RRRGPRLSRPGFHVALERQRLVTVERSCATGAVANSSAPILPQVVEQAVLASRVVAGPAEQPKVTGRIGPGIGPKVTRRRIIPRSAHAPSPVGAAVIAGIGPAHPRPLTRAVL